MAGYTDLSTSLFAGMLCMNASCPNCGYRFRWIECVRSSRCFGIARKVVICPGCGASVIWSKQPWRMMIAGTTVGVGLAGVGMMMGSLEPEASCWMALGFLVFLVGG